LRAALLRDRLLELLTFATENGAAFAAFGGVSATLNLKTGGNRQSRQAANKRYLKFMVCSKIATHTSRHDTHRL
jgi:hypothetical protein